MSEDRVEQEEAKDEDVDAHRRHPLASDEANEEPGTDESDDVEAHHHRTAKHKEL